MQNGSLLLFLGELYKLYNVVTDTRDIIQLCKFNAFLAKTICQFFQSVFYQEQAVLLRLTVWFSQIVQPVFKIQLVIQLFKHHLGLWYSFYCPPTPRISQAMLIPRGAPESICWPPQWPPLTWPPLHAATMSTRCRPHPGARWFLSRRCLSWPCASGRP